MNKIETIPRNAMNAGRVISAANESKLIAARDQIDAVLSALKSDDESNAMNRGKNLSPGILRVAKTGDKEAEIFIYGDIGGYWDGGINAEDFAMEIASLDVDAGAQLLRRADADEHFAVLERGRGRYFLGA